MKIGTSDCAQRKALYRFDTLLLLPNASTFKALGKFRKSLYKLWAIFCNEHFSIHKFDHPCRVVHFFSFRLLLHSFIFNQYWGLAWIIGTLLCRTVTCYFLYCEIEKWKKEKQLRKLHKPERTVTFADKTVAWKIQKLICTFE